MKPFALLPLLVVLAGCAASAAPEVDEPAAPSELPVACSDGDGYEAAAADYAAAWGLPDAWRSFVVAERASFCLAYEVSSYHRAQGGAELAVEACDGDTSDAEGEARTADLERLVSLALPGMPLRLSWRGDGRDGTLGIGCANARGNVRGAWTVHDGGAVHELGHYFGLDHHPEAPSYADEGCTMGRSAVGFDTACRFALGLPAYDDHGAELAAYLDELRCAECAREHDECAAC